MRIFFQAQGANIWRNIIDEPYTPKKVVDGVKVVKGEKEFDHEEKRAIQINAMVINFLFSALDRKEFNRVMTCISAKEI